MPSQAAKRLTRRTFLKLSAASLALPVLSTPTLTTLGYAQRTPVRRERRLRIGAVLPIPTGNPSAADSLGRAAQAGALFGAGLMGQGAAQPTQFTADVLLASAPTADATYRAAQRLIALEGVSVLIGGFDVAQTQILSRTAEEAKILFFNLGTSDEALQTRPGSYTFHLEASASSYLDALLAWFAGLKRQRWFVIYSASDTERTLYRLASRLLAAGRHRARAVGSAEVGLGIDAYASYADVLEQLGDVQADAVLLLLRPEDRDFFLSQYEFSGLDALVTGFPEQLAQTREAYTNTLQSAPNVGAGYRATLWDATLKTPAARALNEEFRARTGTLLEAPSWAAYAAVKMAHDAAQAAASSEPDVLRAYLESDPATFDVGKSAAVSFRPRDHQLRQPLVIVKLASGGAFSTKLSDQLELAQAVGQVPSRDSPW